MPDSIGSSGGSIDIDFVAGELGIRVNGVDYSLLSPDRAVPVDTLADAEKSLLLTDNPYSFNDGTLGQQIVDEITGLSTANITNGDAFEFWYRTPEDIKVYSSANPNRFQLASGTNYADLKISMDFLLELEGDPFYSNYALSTYTYSLEAGESYTLNLSSAGTFANILNLYQVDDAAGTIAGVRPGENGYTALAEQRTIRQITAPSYLGKQTIEGLTVTENTFIASFITTPDGNTFFPWASQNIDQVTHAIRLSDKSFAYEDLLGGEDKDFQDLVVNQKNVDGQKE